VPINTEVYNQKMKTKLIFSFLISTLLLSLLSGNIFGYDDKNNQSYSNELNEAKQRIGNRYWIRKNSNIRFYNSPELSSSESFVITDIKSFIIEDTVKLESFPAYAYKVKFDSGEIAYAGVKTLFSHKDYITTKDFLKEQEEEIKRVQEEQRSAEERKAYLRDAIKSSIGTKLSPNYKGNNIEQVFRQLLTKYPEKGKFETTSEYENKVSSINLNEIYAFQIDYPNTTNFKYDPDDEILTLNLKTRSIDDADSIIIKAVGNKVSSYVGTNAFGAKTVIKKYTGVLYGLIPQKEILSNNINIKPAEAKKHLNTLKVLLICKAFSPYILKPPAFTGAYYDGPTFSDPIEIDYVAKIINVEILELWIYDYKTGKILEKIEYY
jgi:hypothetical protein